MSVNETFIPSGLSICLRILTHGAVLIFPNCVHISLVCQFQRHLARYMKLSFSNQCIQKLFTKVNSYSDATELITQEANYIFTMSKRNRDLINVKSKSRGLIRPKDSCAVYPKGTRNHPLIALNSMRQMYSQIIQNHGKIMKNKRN